MDNLVWGLATIPLIIAIITAIVIVLGAILIIPILICVFSFKRAKKKKILAYRPIVPLVIIAFLGYETYTAIYPTDNFYFAEFKSVTLMNIPKSAKIIKKDASYPDFHGDYCSASLIKLSQQEYTDLLDQISKNKQLKKEKMRGSEELDKVMGDLTLKELTSSYRRIISE